MPPSAATPSDEPELSTHSPAELRRRLRHASVLLGAVELPSEHRLSVLLRVRGHLAGTLHKLDQLLGELRCLPDVLDNELTERLATDRMKPIP